MDGGAEGVLSRLCIASNSTSVTHVVVSLSGMGKHGPILTRAGIEVHCLDMPRGRVTPRGLLGLFAVIKRERPDVVQTWMYHADLLGGLAARLSGHRAIAWGIRHTNLAPEVTARGTRLVARACAAISRWVPTRIICCSSVAAAVHQEIGYDGSRFEIVANGYDHQRFAPSQDARDRLRGEWNLTDNDIVLGMVARWDPQKDHATLIAALGALPPERSWRTILVGSNMTDDNSVLVSLLERHGVRGRVDLLGQRADVPAVMNAMDVHVLSSAGEGFPNVVAEAMASGTPAVVTDVGDAALIVGDLGWISPPRDMTRLSGAIEAAIQSMSDRESWAERRKRARERIVENFSLERMVADYHRVWSDMAVSKL